MKTNTEKITRVNVPAPAMRSAIVRIGGTAPLVMLRFGSEARQVIRAVVTVLNVPDVGPMTVRAYHSLPSDRVNGLGYRPIEEISQAPTMVQELAQSLKRELARLSEKYRHVDSLAHAIRDAIAQVEEVAA